MVTEVGVGDACVNLGRKWYSRAMGRPKGSKNRTAEEKLLAAAVVNPEKHPMRESEWQVNHNKIRKVVMTHWISNQSVPSDDELARMTGLHVNTIGNHWKDFDMDEMKELVKQQAALMVQPVMWGLYNGAMKGSPEAAKIILKLGMDFSMVDEQKQGDTNIIVMSDEDIMGVEAKLLKLSRRVERDHKLGIVEGEVVDATESK